MPRKKLPKPQVVRILLEPIPPDTGKLADPFPRWVALEKETDSSWYGRPVANPACPSLEWPKFAWCQTDIDKRAISALKRTWQAIGFDVLGNETTSIPADEVREAVSCCGFVDGYPSMYGDDKLAVAWLELQPEEIQTELLALAFPQGRYGL